MENKTIDIDNIKVAIFDFDDTLAIHKDKNYLKRRYENEDNYLNYYLKAYLNPNCFYETIEPCDISASIYKLINILKNKGVKIYCVSGMKYSFHLKAKEHFVHKYYDENIEVFTAGTQELKCNAIKIIQRINNCSLNEMLFVDDIKENIVMFNNMGIHALLPSEVDNIKI